MDPPPSLSNLVKRLIRGGIPTVIVVNDGSSAKSAPVFGAVEKVPGVHLLHLPRNRGKGRALKEGFQYFLKNLSAQACGVVCADADGQHHPEDILKVARELFFSPEDLILGAREFSKEVPLKNRVGNLTMRKLFNLVLGIRIPDTQTGLRAVPKFLISELLELRPDGFEFEISSLLRSLSRGQPIQFVKIRTIYFGDQNSNFRWGTDSARIVFAFFKFLYTENKSRRWKLQRRPLQN